MKKIYLSIACLCLASSLVASEKKSSKIMPLGPVHGTSGTVVPSGQLLTNIKAVFMKKNDAYDGSDKINDPTKRDMSVQRYNFITRYGLGSGFDIRAIIPVFHKNLNMYNPRARSGGDLVILA